MARQGRQKRRPGLRGTNLSRDPRTGIYVWRRKHKLTGRRFRRSTGTRILRMALVWAHRYEEEYQRELAGLSNFGDYRRPLSAFVEPFLASLSCSERRVKRLRAYLLRAFRMLRLKVLADLEDFMKIERRLPGLSRSEGFSRTTLVRTFQDPLKQFSRYLSGRREVHEDHLAAWPRLKREPQVRRRRALLPDEMARILAASDCLDAMWDRRYPMRPVWTALLVTAPRISALAALDVEDIDREGGRLLLKGNDIKRAGAANLDEKTSAEVLAHVGDRSYGPLFLSPEGKRIDTRRSLRRWKATVSLAMVDLEWPEAEPRDPRLVYLVHLALTTGRARVAMGGPLTGVNAPGPDKRAARRAKAERVSAIADGIRPRWQERVLGVDQHCLRMTHRTWVLAAGVPEILIDRQLGHSSPAGEAALHAVWSLVGRKHYTDMSFLTFDARRSAEAARGMLDRAEAHFQEAVDRGETALCGGRRRPAARVSGALRVGLARTE